MQLLKQDIRHGYVRRYLKMQESRDTLDIVNLLEWWEKLDALVHGLVDVQYHDDDLE